MSNGAAALKYHPLGGKKPKPVQVEPSVSTTNSATNAVDAVWTKKVQYLALLIIVGLVIVGFAIACGVDWIYNSYYATASTGSENEHLFEHVAASSSEEYYSSNEIVDSAEL